MDFLKRLFAGPTRSRAGNFYPLAVQCHRCGEVIQAQINLNNDLSAEYGEAGNTTTYVCHKTLLGKEHCFQRLEVTLTFDANHQLMDRQVTGGKFVEG